MIEIWMLGFLIIGLIMLGHIVKVVDVIMKRIERMEDNISIEQLEKVLSYEKDEKRDWITTGENDHIAELPKVEEVNENL